MNSYENPQLSYECDLTAERDRLREALQGMVNAYAPNAERTVAMEGAQALQSDVRRALQALGCIMPDEQLARAKEST